MNSSLRPSVSDYLTLLNALLWYPILSLVPCILAIPTFFLTLTHLRNYVLTVTSSSRSSNSVHMLHLHVTLLTLVAVPLSSPQTGPFWSPQLKEQPHNLSLHIMILCDSLPNMYQPYHAHYFITNIFYKWFGPGMACSDLWFYKDSNHCWLS